MTELIKILLVDDEATLREPLADYLIKQNFDVTQADDASVARTLLKNDSFDIILSDIMMPGEDGLSFCRYVREHTDIPVIFISAKTEETERIIGLELGADDYITKPFSPRELVARIKVVLRRVEGGSKGVTQNAETGYRFSNWMLAVEQRNLSDAQGVNVPLSSGEFELLLALLMRAGQVLNRDQLLDITKGREAHAFDRSIDNQISRLRRKIELDPKNPEIIKTIWGGGYVLAGQVTAL